VADIRVTGLRQKELWGTTTYPPVEEVRPGLWSIPVPIPNNHLRYVLVYALELDNGVAIVDAGWNTDEAWSALGAGLEQAGGSLADVAAVVVTHIHPDHYGLAGRVREHSGAWIGLHPADAKLVVDRYEHADGLVGRQGDLLTMAGVEKPERTELAGASMPVLANVSDGTPDRLIEDGERLDLGTWDLRAIWTPGHSPGHLCLYSEAQRVLLAGDHLLPRISPNISVHTQQVANPLGDYLDSLLRVRSLDADEVLPGHEYRFSGLDARVDQLIEHHEARCEEVVAIVAERSTATAWEVTRGLVWSRAIDDFPGYLRRAALGEALAHLVLLEARGRLRREGTAPARFSLPA
jgi:glyoxylase-like metal-dependent hydrolase (beta-lactamase superfamily II)